MDNTYRVIRFIADTAWEDLPDLVRHQSKRCLLDGLGALLAGARTPVAELVSLYVQEHHVGDGATLLGNGARVSLPGAALANGTAANALDIDDGYRLIKGHPGACVLPLALAAAEATGCSGQEFLGSLVVGNEVGIRAGLIRHAVSETYHASGSWGSIAGAAVAGKLFGLDAMAIRHAMGTAEYHAPIAPMMKGIRTPSMGKDSIAWGCMVAMSSALMAQKGFTGVRPLFDDTPEPSWIRNLGDTYEILNLYFKPYSACQWAQPAIEGALGIMRDHGLSTEQIRSIRVQTFEEAAAMDRSYPQTTVAAQYSLSYPLAVALLDGEVGPRQVLLPRIHDLDVRSMMDRVEVVAEPRFQDVFPAEALAEVLIETQSGETLCSGTTSARWEPSSGLPSDLELIEKFRWLVEPTLGVESAEAVEKMVWVFEDCATVQELAELCTIWHCDRALWDGPGFPREQLPS